eukprot:CAMPEP_0202497552 /NCGR_PEP_ID=MMETSP1361-20130828/23128_1 /ASSEMBLY_ACC=CAM_ASM_000849 /TAXON_ID=210615 /ORGANISM="Staurosira complex sp., Strain CCMP2646" /LENGTH=548 /DNA_ID=CAMNT_0049129185 /DNA_START=27 /DNA_END=1673 /DNA_ORIENTATION=+
MPSRLNQPSSLPPDATLQSNEETSITSTVEKQLVAWKRHRRKFSSQRQSDHSNQLSHLDSPKAYAYGTTTWNQPEQCRFQSRTRRSSSRHQTRSGGDDSTSFEKRHHLRESHSNHPPTTLKKENRNQSADSFSIDSDRTPVAKPGREKSDSEGPCGDQESNSSLSSLDVLEGFTHASSRGSDPPTDLEFAIEMDSAAKKLKKFAKNQEEAVFRKQVDYDQLQGLLDICANDPKEADQVNRLLITMGESAAEIDTSDDHIFTNTKDASNLVSSDKHWSLADYLYDSLGNESSSSLTAAEIESVVAALQSAGRETTDASGSGAYIDEIQQQREVEQEALNSVQEHRMLDSASINRKLAAVDGRSRIPCHRSVDERHQSPTVSQPTRMEIHKQEVLQVFGGSFYEEDIGAAIEESVCVPNNMAMHKQEVLEICGVQARPRTRKKSGKFVSIPLRPAVLTRAKDEAETIRAENEMKVSKIVETMRRESIGFVTSKAQSVERVKVDEQRQGSASNDAFSNLSEGKAKIKSIQLRTIAKRLRGARNKTSQDIPE